MLFNTSNNTNVYLSDDPSFNAGTSDTDYVILRPLASFVIIANMYLATINVQDVVVFTLPGISATPSPIDSAASLITAGLATSALQTTNISTIETSNQYLAGTTPGALISTTGISVSQDMLHANSGVTTELASILATGAPGGTTGGIPLLVFGNNVLVNGANQNLPINTAQQYGPFTINQPSYDGYLSVTSSAAGGTPVLTILFAWTQGGVTLYQDLYYVYQGQNGAAAHTIRFKGPTKATSLTIFITPTGHSAILNQFQVMQHSRVYPYDIWRSESNSQFQNAGASSQVGYDLAANILASVSPINIGAASSQILTLPLWVGRAQLQASSASSAADLTVTISSASETNVSNVGNVYQAISNGNGLISSVPIVLPRAQCQLTLKNGNAAAQNINFFLTIAEY